MQMKLFQCFFEIEFYFFKKVFIKNLQYNGEDIFKNKCQKIII